MGLARTEVAGGSEITLAVPPVLLATIPQNACDGQMTFLKRTAGDTVYIGLKGKNPTAQNYDIILTDASPSFSEDGLVVGDIKALGSVLTSRVTCYISYNIKGRV